jgi:hypothetical protein
MTAYLRYVIVCNGADNTCEQVFYAMTKLAGEARVQATADGWQCTVVVRRVQAPAEIRDYCPTHAAEGAVTTTTIRP